MPRIKFNDGQEILHSDLDKIAQAIEKELMDRISYEMGARQTDLCFGDSFLVEYVSATSVSVRAGNGVQTDSTQTDPEPKKRLLSQAASETIAVAAADGANPRIDIVCIRANRATTASESRNFKDVDDSVSVVSMVVKTDWDADLLVVAGTPAGSPAVPSTPAGYIKIAELAIAAATGLPALGGITDKRNVYLPGSSRLAYATKVADYTGTSMDELTLFDTSGGNRTHTLPPAASCPGKIIRSMKSTNDANTLTIDGNGSETINGELTQVIDYQYTMLSMLSIGTGWVLV